MIPDVRPRPLGVPVDPHEALMEPAWSRGEEHAGNKRRWRDRNRAREAAEILGLDCPAWAERKQRTSLTPEHREKIRAAAQSRHKEAR